MFPYLEQFEDIADFESELPLPCLQQTESYPIVGPPLSDYMAEPRVHDAQGFLDVNLPNNP
jgi:hypothetical protein